MPGKQPGIVQRQHERYPLRETGELAQVEVAPVEVVGVHDLRHRGRQPEKFPRAWIVEVFVPEELGSRTSGVPDSGQQEANRPRPAVFPFAVQQRATPGIPES